VSKGRSRWVAAWVWPSGWLQVHGPGTQEGLEDRRSQRHAAYTYHTQEEATQVALTCKPVNCLWSGAIRLPKDVSVAIASKLL